MSKRTKIGCVVFQQAIAILIAFVVYLTVVQPDVRTYTKYINEIKGAEQANSIRII